MTTLTHTYAERHIEVECLDCGTCRPVIDLSIDALGVCPACSYIGWTLAGSITETDLDALRLLHGHPNTARG